MPQWMLVLLGVVAGTFVVGASLAWSFWPRELTWLPRATDGSGDPMSGGTDWHGDGVTGGDGHGGW